MGWNHQLVDSLLLKMDGWNTISSVWDGIISWFVSQLFWLPKGRPTRIDVEKKNVSDLRFDVYGCFFEIVHTKGQKNIGTFL